METKLFNHKATAFFTIRSFAIRTSRLKKYKELETIDLHKEPSN